jgi:uncharacterized protein YukE
MRICNLSDGLGQLTHAAADLNQRWAEAQEFWKDEASRDFEAAHLRPIQPQLQALISAVQALAATVERAARDLSDVNEG